MQRKKLKIKNKKLVTQKIEQNCGIHTEIPDKQKRIYRTGAEAISAVTDCATAQTIRMRNAKKTIALSINLW